MDGTWPLEMPSHGGNTGSNPVGDAIKNKDLDGLRLETYPTDAIYVGRPL
jgi:hypothetical protein